MLWIIHGGDYTKQQKEIQNIKDKSKPDVIVRFDEWNPEVFALAESTDLFQETRLVIVSQVDISDIEKDIASYHNSKNLFIFSFPSLTTKELKLFSDVSCIDVRAEENKKPKKFNTFSITDAFLTKNKKNIWVLYQQALREGVATQEIHGLVLWQIRMLFVVMNTPKKDSGMNPFVFEKTKKALDRFTSEDLKRYETQLVSMYHESRMEKAPPFETLFERFILHI